MTAPVSEHAPSHGGIMGASSEVYICKTVRCIRPPKRESHPGTWGQSTLACPWHASLGISSFPAIGSTFVCCSSWGTLTPSPPGSVRDILQYSIWLLSLPPVTSLSASLCICTNICHAGFSTASLWFDFWVSPHPASRLWNLYLIHVCISSAWHTVDVQ